MQNLNTDDLFSMEVINLCGGTRLGCITSLDIDVGQNPPCVLFLHVPADYAAAALLPFSKRDVYRIPWCRVECVGEDTILVRLNASELSECRVRPEKRRRNCK